MVLERSEASWGSKGPTCAPGEAFLHDTGDEGSPKLGCQTAAALRVGSRNRLMLVHIDLLVGPMQDHPSLVTVRVSRALFGLVTAG